MTDLEQLLAAGLSQEEAELILARRQAKPVAPVGTRLALALRALNEAVRKTGVAPVRVAGDVLEKSEPQDLEALERFYSTKGPDRWREEIQGEWVETRRSSPQKHSVDRLGPLEDQSQDPEDY